jgi:DNA-binding PadR family transcriptional regulator
MVSHKTVTNSQKFSKYDDLEKKMFYSEMFLPVSWALIPLCELAESRGTDFHPGIFLTIIRQSMKGQPSWKLHHMRQSIIRAFEQNVRDGIWESWISVTKRGRKRKLFRLTEKGRTRLNNYADHLRHFNSLAEESLGIELESVRSSLDQLTKQNTTNFAPTLDSTNPLESNNITD